MDLWVDAGRSQPAFLGLASERLRTGGLIAATLGHFPKARSLLDSARAQEHPGDLLARAERSYCEGSAALLQGDHHTALLELRTSVELLKRLGRSGAWIDSAMMLAVQLGASGRVREGLALLDEVEAQPGLQRVHQLRSAANRAHLLFVSHQQGHPVGDALTQAGNIYASLLESPDARDLLHETGNLRVRLAAVALARGDLDEVGHQLDAVDENPEEAVANGHWLLELVRARHDVLRAKSTMRLRSLQAELATRLEDKVSPSWVQALRLVLMAELQQAMGDQPGATSSLEQARVMEWDAVAHASADDADALLAFPVRTALSRLMKAHVQSGELEAAFAAAEQAFVELARRQISIAIARNDLPAQNRLRDARRALAEVEASRCTLVADEAREACQLELSRLRSDVEIAYEGALEPRPEQRAGSTLAVQSGTLARVRSALREDERLLMAIRAESGWHLLWIGPRNTEYAPSLDALDVWLGRQRLDRVYVVSAFDEEGFDFELRPDPSGAPWSATVAWLHLGHAGELLKPASRASGQPTVVVDPDGTLPGARMSFASSIIDGRLLQGEAATEDALWRSLTDSRWFHFSGHGQVASGHALGSRLRLADADCDPTDFLTRPVRVGAAFLNGCSTGASTRRGRLGFPQAILHGAGAELVIASLAPVEEVASRRFVADFYSSTARDPVTAFREAVRASVERGDNVHRSFRLLGPARGLKLPSVAGTERH